jgi:hypothetical protein
MSRVAAVLAWLEDTSDWLSPIVVKEVRQVVRGREFHYSFSISLLIGLAVAFFGATDAINGTGTSGRGTFVALMACLTLLGLAVVPLGAFSALRNERLEQTFDLITLTALSPRRVIVGKLLAQGVKLVTLFAGLAPFIAMSFLLGGIDFGSILISLFVLFIWSMWACAACLFLSSLLRSRAMSGLVLGGIAFVMFIVLVLFGLPRVLFGLMGGGGGATVAFGFTGSNSWRDLLLMTTFCLATMINLILLAENRLALPSEHKVTPLRIGFFGQFLLIVAWVLTAMTEPAPVRTTATYMLGFFGGLHLGLVAMFVVTEDLVVSRRLHVRMQSWSAWRRTVAIFRPGGGRGAVYVVAQMVILLLTALALRPDREALRWLLALCGYICFLSGVPALLFRFRHPARAAAFKARVAVLLLFSATLVLPDLLYFLLWQPSEFSIRFSARHLFSPLGSLINWRLIESTYGFWAPAMLGLTGLGAYLLLVVISREEPAAIESHGSAEARREPDRANVY